MIKAEDLRIGDLVIVNENCSLEQGTIGKVSEVRSTPLYKENEGSIGLKPISNDRWPWGVLCRNIDPIPLTPEILEKNGFNMREDTVVYAKNRLGLKPLGDGKGYQVGLGSLRLLFVKVSIIKYVHELQHILWALGLDAELKV
ncbi:hypothetical protein [uncultured Prevotella sp.]|jgi:hypothetical protein|uniref:hypothetical protein n=1 Tax=uncultured Prevotella sp. TaxID=159272 RepID=UPI0027E31EF9|nr:hypothetical protein [uncultured Prevotella sp.]